MLCGIVLDNILLVVEGERVFFGLGLVLLKFHNAFEPFKIPLLCVSHLK